jgi:hypothetical protein
MGDQELAAEGGQGGARVEGSAMAAKSGSGRRPRNGGGDGGPVLLLHSLLVQGISHPIFPWRL